MTTEQINHDPAHTYMNTGTQISGRPSMGSWVLYGLGAETNNLPGFVVLTSVGGGQNQPIASRQWHSGFLPSKYQGVHFHSKGDPVLYLSNPNGVTNKDQRSVIDSVNQLNRIGNRKLRDPKFQQRSANTKWHSVCNRAYLISWMYPRNQNTSWICMEPSRETALLQATACLQGDWQKRESASFIFIIVDGTTMVE